MAKITINNSFNGGLITDLSVFNTPLDSVSDSLNMELITIGGDQYLYQNLKGNSTLTDSSGNLVDLGSFSNIDNIEYKFIPLGIKVYNDIAYILAGSFDSSGDFLTGTIGTFPSPNWEELNTVGKSSLRKEFSPLHNFKSDTNTSGKYTDPFISTRFDFIKNKFIDIVVQGDFDRSANVIFTDNYGTTRIIGTRFKSTDVYETVEIAERRGNNDGNIYTNNDWDRIDLLQISDIPITVKTFSIIQGGSLLGGGYKYFFKYITQEGNTTDILYESPLIPISNGLLGLNKNQISDKTILFELEDLDSSYIGVQVYFAHFDGFPDAVGEYFKIDYIFNYTDGSVVINHSGIESVTAVTIEEINTPFSPIDTVRSMDIVNDRIALAGIKATLSEEHISILEEASKEIYLWESTKDITTSYNDPNTAAKELGYWPGEVYEMGVVYMLKNKGLSPVFPITGMDNIYNAQENFVNNEYPSYILDNEGFDPDHLINNKGVFRFSKGKDIYTPICGEEGIRTIRYLKADTSRLFVSPGLNDIVTGFFIVRRERIKNVLMQGMMVPTLKLPSKKPSISPKLLALDVKINHSDFIGEKRYLLQHFPVSTPTLGLNAKYSANYYEGSPTFTTDFSIAYVPQPTQTINILSHSKSYMSVGSIGQNIGDDTFSETVNFEGENTNEMHLAFFSNEIDLNLPNINNILTGSSPSLEIQQMKNEESPVGESLFNFYKSGNTADYTKGITNIIVTNLEKISNDRADFITIESNNVKTTLVNSGVEITANNSFTGKTDRALGLLSSVDTDKVLPYHDFSPRPLGTDENYLSSTSRHQKIAGTLWEGGDYKPYSLISQSYSVYLGIKINTSEIATLPNFKYKGTVTNNLDDLANGDDISSCISTNTSDPFYFLNVGHLSNLFRTPSGRWNREELKNIYKYDNNKPYHNSTGRFLLNTSKISIFQGDGFISKFFKRVTYKNGVGVMVASASDAGTFGVGINKDVTSDFSDENMLETYLKDNGRNLFDVGQIIEMVTYSNINADIRSTEEFSTEETEAIGYDRDFYPHKDEAILGDPRPDSIMYNQGYSPNNQVIGYFRIEENAAVFSTEFPNRIMLSEKNQAQEFYNSFRDLRGFNFRDYGLEYGPIIKIITINSLLLSIHRKGILAVGVDDRTLLAEGSDIYVDTAKSLSPKAAVISDIYGSDHPESIVKSDSTVLGVDYNSDSIWMYMGGKIKVISEFAIKILLKEFKEKITAGKFKGEDDNSVYISRVYSTFNHIKHTLYVTYTAEDPDTGEQFDVGTITYNTVINKWMSRISEGNKFLLKVTSSEYSFGFKEIHNIWEEDSLIDSTTGKYVRNRLRGVDYKSEFEIILNDKPTYEKILENILVLCNKRIPTEVIYTTSGDVNDPAIDIWGDEAKSVITRQPIKTRGDSTRKELRLGILDQNAYYRDSKLYIEAGKVGYSIKASNSKRIRDKHIKVRFIYEGNDELFVQAIISILSISQN